MDNVIAGNHFYEAISSKYDPDMQFALFYKLLCNFRAFKQFMIEVKVVKMRSST